MSIETNLETIQPPNSLLTMGEFKCLVWIANGKSMNEVADLLSLTEHTIALYCESVVTKLEARSLPHAIAKAMKLGLLDESLVT